MMRLLKQHGNLFGLVILIMILSLGCTSHKPIMPQMDLPPEPIKPKIQSSVIVQNNTPWVAYKMEDTLQLYEYLLKKDAYEDMLRNRIKTMNELWTVK